MKDKVENKELNPGQQLLHRNHILRNKLQRFTTGLALKCLVPYRLFESWVQESISLLQLQK